MRPLTAIVVLVVAAVLVAVLVAPAQPPDVGAWSRAWCDRDRSALTGHTAPRRISFHTWTGFAARFDYVDKHGTAGAAWVLFLDDGRTMVFPVIAELDGDSAAVTIAASWEAAAP